MVPNKGSTIGATRTEGSGGCNKYEYTCPAGSNPVEGDNTKCRKDIIYSNQTCTKKHYVAGSGSSYPASSGGGHEECSEYKYECPSGYKLVEGDNSKCKYQSSSKPSSAPSTLTPEQKQKAKAAGVEAAGKDLLAKNPELAKITSDPKVVGECIAEARSSAASAGRYAQGSGGTSEELRQQFLAECLAKKTGKSVDEIKAALQGADITGAIAAGEQQQQATEQQLAQEQAAEGEEENKGECGTKLDAIGYFVCPLLEKLVDFADGTWGLFEYLLQTDPLPSEEGPLQSAWNGLRDVAN